MSLAIYSKYKFDIWKHLIETDVLKFDDADKRSNSSANLYYGEHLYCDAMHTTYCDWNPAFNILYDNAKSEERQTFNDDSFGFIPPHILKRITESNSFQRKKADLEYRLECLMEIGCNDDEIEVLEHTIKILDFIVERADEGIYYH